MTTELKDKDNISLDDYANRNSRMSVFVFSTTGSGDLSLGTRWKELF